MMDYSQFIYELRNQFMARSRPTRVVMTLTRGAPIEGYFNQNFSRDEVVFFNSLDQREAYDPTYVIPASSIVCVKVHSNQDYG